MVGHRPAFITLWFYHMPSCWGEDGIPRKKGSLVAMSKCAVSPSWPFTRATVRSPPLHLISIKSPPPRSSSPVQENCLVERIILLRAPVLLMRRWSWAMGRWVQRGGWSQLAGDWVGLWGSTELAFTSSEGAWWCFFAGMIKRWWWNHGRGPQVWCWKIKVGRV